jgi:hypothetical protein
MQPSVSQFAIPVISMLANKLAVLFSTYVAGFFATSIFGLEVTEFAGAAHGYPGLCDINGKKLANAEFRQWVEDDHLFVVITYKFPDGELREEKARFRQHPGTDSGTMVLEGTQRSEAATRIHGGFSLRNRQCAFSQRQQGCVRKSQYREGSDVRRIRIHHRIEQLAQPPPQSRTSRAEGSWFFAISNTQTTSCDSENFVWWT